MKTLNFAVMRSGFGDYWISKTELEINEASIFSTFDAAMEVAKSLNDSVENLDELDSTTEEEIKEISKEMEVWII